MIEEPSSGTGSTGGASIVRGWDDGRSVSTTVVEAVGSLTDRDPATMEPLYGWADPDALDDLFEGRSSRSGRIAVSFTYLDCFVTVIDEGLVHVAFDDYSN